MVFLDLPNAPELNFPAVLKEGGDQTLNDRSNGM